MGILSSIFGGAFGSEVHPGAMNTEEGFVDIDLPIVDMKRGKDGVSTFVGRGKLDGLVVGLVVDVLPQWTAKEVQEGLVFYWGRARLRSLGEDSGRLAILAKYYGVSETHAKMAARIEASAVGLNDNPERVMEIPVKMKFFLSEDSEKDYSEVFINVDAANRALQFHEKDAEYRQSLLRVLSEGT